MEQKILGMEFVGEICIEGIKGDVYKRPHALVLDEGWREEGIFVTPDGKGSLLRKDQRWDNSTGRFHDRWEYVTGRFHDRWEDCLKRVLINDLEQHLLEAFFDEFDREKRYQIENGKHTISLSHSLEWDRWEEMGQWEREKTIVYIIDGERVEYGDFVPFLQKRVTVPLDLVGFKPEKTLSQKWIKDAVKGDVNYLIFTPWMSLGDKPRPDQKYFHLGGRGILYTSNHFTYLVDTNMGIMEQIPMKKAEEMICEFIIQENQYYLDLLSKQMEENYYMHREEVMESYKFLDSLCVKSRLISVMMEVNDTETITFQFGYIDQDGEEKKQRVTYGVWELDQLELHKLLKNVSRDLDYEERG